MSSDITDSTAYYDFLAWLEVNKKRLITISIVIAILALVVSWVVWSKNEKEKEASAALIKLTFSVPGDNAPQPSAADFNKIAEQYAGTHAAERATLLAAGASFTENRYEDALKQFQSFQTQFASSSLIPVALVGIAACQESLDRIDEAIKSYQDIKAKFPNEPVSIQANTALGRLYEIKKQPELAIKAYTEATRQPSRNAWFSIASELKESLLAQHPELAPIDIKTNQVKPAPISISPATNAAKPASAPTNSASKAVGTNAAPVKK